LGVRLGGLNQKCKKNFSTVPHGELTAKNGSIPSTNRQTKKEASWRSVTNGRQTDRQTVILLLTIMTPSLARRSTKQNTTTAQRTVQVKHLTRP